MSGGEYIQWRIGGRQLSWRAPAIMGIINTTPDSFHAPSRSGDIQVALARAEQMVNEGARFLDIGAASSRPGSKAVDGDEELRRLLPVLAAIRERFPEVLISVDTYRACVAKEAVAAGADVVNDIGAGLLDPAMFATVAALGVPYIAMHMQGTPATMQQAPHYEDVVAEVRAFLRARMDAAMAAGIQQLVVDPGLGFGKTDAHNFTLLGALPELRALGAPLLVGLSRKRLITSTLGITPAQALNGTTVLNTVALLNGADILRVHDVGQAQEALLLVEVYRSASFTGRSS